MPPKNTIKTLLDSLSEHSQFTVKQISMSRIIASCMDKVYDCGS